MNDNAKLRLGTRAVGSVCRKLAGSPVRCAALCADGSFTLAPLKSHTPDLVTACKRLFLCTAVLAASFGDAAVVPWIYTVEVAVSSQADAERRRASRAALSTLLTRLTGMSEIPHTADVRDALQRPADFYTSYRFERRGVEGREGEGTVLTIRFEPASVQGLLRRAGLPIWAADRPSILAWLVVERGGARERLGGVEAVAVAQALEARARERGLEVFLPLNDRADMELGAAELWGRFWERIDAASARYGAELLLLGRLRDRGDGSWDAAWDLRGRQSALVPRFDDAAPRRSSSRPALPAASFRHRVPSAALAVQAAVDSAAEVLADRFAVRGGLRAIAVTVRGAQTVRGYASLLAHLRSREYIERFEIGFVERDAMHFRLHSRSSPEQLRELLTIAGRFEIEERADVFSADQTGKALTLLWRGPK